MLIPEAPLSSREPWILITDRSINLRPIIIPGALACDILVTLSMIEPRNEEMGLRAGAQTLACLLNPIKASNLAKDPQMLHMVREVSDRLRFPHTLNDTIYHVAVKSWIGI